MDEICTGFAPLCWASQAVDALLRGFGYIFNLILSGLISVLNLLPLPFDSNDIVSIFSQIPPEVMWFAEIVQLQAGASIVIGSYLTRFIIRRIPIIG